MSTKQDRERRESQMRDLSEQEIEGIRSEEGMKAAYEVADDFNIEPWRVRALWSSGPEPDDFDGDYFDREGDD